MYAELAGMALSLQPGEAFYIPLKTGKGPEGGAPWRDHALKELSPVLMSEKILKHGHDLKSTLIVLARLGIRLWGRAATPWWLLPSQPLEEEPRHHRGGPGIPG